ncbi:MAG TPA: FHA domain-containing protein [Polyangiaceae bacterium]|nr:FHA domain-containing protein [Polyangiaceae bacterium]
MMRDCHQCGEPNQPSARFCVVCGAPMVAAAPAPQRVPAQEARSPLPPAAAGGLPPPPVVPGAPGLPPPPIAGTPAARPVPRPPSGSHDPVGTGRSLELPPDAPRVLVGFLVSFDHVELGQYWPIHQGRNVVGRQGAASGVQIEIAHPTTSSLHAVLLAVARPGRVVVEDHNSTNGTFVNENALAAGQRWELRDGDRVRFGLFNTIIKVIESNYALPGVPAAAG